VISLDSPEWAQFRHAYGAAANIPLLIKQLAGTPRRKGTPQEEPWFSLWSALCHQGDVYDASYAALPHFVRIANTAAGPIDFDFFLLPACIEVARSKGRGPKIPTALSEAYFGALQNLHECAFRHAADAWDIDMTRSVAAALAAAKGQYRLAEALIDLDADLIDRIVRLDL
jgi:hypothetical protein